MGREVKRVALNFSWPLKKIWKGYVCPYRSAGCCVACDGTGYNAETRKLYDKWYSSDDCEWVWSVPGEVRYNVKAWSNNLDADDVKALVDAGRLWEFVRRPRNAEQAALLRETGDYWLPENNGYMPTPEEVNAWNRGRGLGHDSLNMSICVREKAKRLGVYGLCSVCDGYGNIYADGERELAENWEGYEPPSGDGYQLWETTSEGSPVSPVFETPEDLAKWLTETGASSFGDMTEDYDTWLKFIRGPGWAPSGVLMNGEPVVSGVKASAKEE